MLAWEPSADKVTKSYFRRLPALERVYQETKFSLFKLESQKNIPFHRSFEFPNQKFMQIGPGVSE